MIGALTGRIEIIALLGAIVRRRSLSIADLACVAAASTGCTYLHYIAKQRDYSHSRALALRQHTYKPCLQLRAAGSSFVRAQETVPGTGRGLHLHA